MRLLRAARSMDESDAQSDYTASFDEVGCLRPSFDIDRLRRVLGTDQSSFECIRYNKYKVSQLLSRAANLQRSGSGHGTRLWKYIRGAFPIFLRGRTYTSVCFRNLRSIPELCSTRIHGNSIDSIHRCSFSSKFAEMDTTFVWPRTWDLGSRLRLWEKNASAAPQMQTYQKHWDQTPTRRRSVDDKSNSI